jgi:minor extracellular serine protease Vpr
VNAASRSSRRRAAVAAAATVLAAAWAAAPAGAASRVAAERAAIDGRGSRIEVVTTLRLPSLVQYARQQRTLQGYGSHGRVLAAAFGSRLYLGHLRTLQSATVRRLQAAIPAARVHWRYGTVLDGLAVTLPRHDVTTLARLPDIKGVYPSIQYHALTDTVPGVVDAPAVWGPGLAGAGEGIKIGVIDDGIDQTNPFFAPQGLTPPPSYPRGNRRYTTGKVIVARSFPPPGGDAASHLPFDPRVSEHGTHVSGILAGDNGTTAHPGGGLPTVMNLSGVAPKAYLGNYRALAVADPRYGAVGGTAEIAAAVDRAVADGMNVLNLSLGGTEIDPNADALAQAVENAVRAGVVVVIAAGNSQDELGFGSVGSPGSSSDVITVAATTTSRFFGVPGSVTGPGAVPPSLRIFGATTAASPPIPNRFANAAQRIVDASAIGDGNLCRAPAGHPFAGAVVLVDRDGCSFFVKAKRARQAGASAVVLRNTQPGDPFSIDAPLDLPVAFVSENTGDALRSFIRGAGGSAQVTLGHNLEEVPGTAKVMTTFSSGGPTPYDHILKPDISAPGQSILSSVPAASKNFPGPFAVFDGTSMATPAVAGAAALLLQAHPGWTPDLVKAALMGSAQPAFSDAAGTVEASVLREGAGFLDVAAADHAGVAAEPSSLSYGFVDGGRGATKTLGATLVDIGAPGAFTVSVEPQPGSLAGVSVTVPPQVVVPAGGSGALAVQLHVPAGTAAGDATGFVVLQQGAVRRRIPYWAYVERPAIPSVHARTIHRTGSFLGSTRGRSDHVDFYRYPTNASADGVPSHFAGGERFYRFHLSLPVINVGATVEDLGHSRVVPLLLRGRDENNLVGESGLPLDVGPISFTSGTVEPSAGLWWAPSGEYTVAVDSGSRRGEGRYRLRVWVNDLTPPSIVPLTRHVRAGRPSVVRLRITDSQSGVDPRTLIGELGTQAPEPLGYDQRTRVATLVLPPLRPGTYTLAAFAADYAQTKDVLDYAPGPSNTMVIRFHVRVTRH